MNEGNHGESMSAIDGIRRQLQSYKPELTKTEQEFINKLPEEQRPLEMAKLKLQKEQELVSFITNLLKQMHESRMAIINNMR
jgi:hypothetical protein